MDRTTRPLVIVAAFAGALLVGLLLMLWALGGLRNVAAPAAIGGRREHLALHREPITVKRFVDPVAVLVELHDPQVAIQPHPCRLIL